MAVMEVTFDAQSDSGLSKVAAYPHDEWNLSENNAPRDWVYLFEQIDDLELMWPTGRKDAKGVEIYEDDIVIASDYWGERGIVYWNEKELQWWIRRSSGGGEPLRTPFANGHFAFEVLGNLYEGSSTTNEDQRGAEV